MSLNLRAYFGPGGTQAEDLAELIASHQPDVALLAAITESSPELITEIPQGGSA